MPVAFYLFGKKVEAFLSWIQPFGLICSVSPIGVLVQTYFLTRKMRLCREWCIIFLLSGEGLHL